jgi:anti-sigma regulatory factor (Ser/Thr protein kinase)
MAPAAPAELDLVLPVEPPSVPAARRAVEGVAHAAGACPGTVEALRLAVSEACTNVILHAYRESEDDAGRLHVHAVADGNDLRVVVCDHGVGFTPRTDSPGLGLGMPLMAQLTEQLDVEQHDGINRLSMLFRLDRPPRVFGDVTGTTATAVAG